MASRSSDPRQLSDLLEVSQTLGSTLNLRAGAAAGARDARGAPRRARAPIFLLDDDDRRAGGRGRGRDAGRPGPQGALPRGRGHHRPRGPERQAGRRAAGQPASRCSSNRTGVWKRLGPGRAELRLRAHPARRARRSARSGVGLPYQKDRAYDQRGRSSSGSWASMIGQALRVHRLVEAERQRLLQENTQLRQELRERLRPPQHRRQQPAHAAGLRAGGAGGAREHHRAGARRDRAPARSWSRTPSTTTRRAPASRSSRSAAARCPRRLIESELFGYEPGAFTDARAPEEGPLRAGPRRHAVPGRGRRAVARHAGEAAARPAGARVRAPGRRAADQGQRPPDRRHQQGPGGGGQAAARSARTSTTG